jgi:hypothetical protein
MWRWAIGVGMLSGCTGETSTEPAPAPTVDGVALTRFEARLLGEQLSDIRAGVRPWGEQSLGICTHEDGSRTCPTFLGADAGELPPGAYQIYAELRAPAVGPEGTWTIDFSVHCMITSASGQTSPHDYSKAYTVTYAGEERGFRLSPLYKITSPSSGSRDCQWALSAPHPDRDIVYTGSWSSPAKDGQ